MYRNDLDAAKSRIEALEAELARARARLAASQASPRCGSEAHARDLDRLTRLTEQANDARARARERAAAVIRLPHQAALEQRIAEQRQELADLELLGRGDAALLAEIAACDQDLLGSEANDGRALVVHAPPREITPRSLRSVRGLACGALGVMIVWGFIGGIGLLVAAAVLAGVAALELTGDGSVTTGAISEETICGRSWSTVRAIQLGTVETRPRMVVVFDRDRFVFDAGTPEFDHLVAAVRAAARTHCVAIHGELPALNRPELLEART